MSTKWRDCDLLIWNDFVISIYSLLVLDLFLKSFVDGEAITLNLRRKLKVCMWKFSRKAEICHLNSNETYLTSGEI